MWAGGGACHSLSEIISPNVLESDAARALVLEELEEGDIVVDEQPVNASQDQGSRGISLQHIGTYDLTQAMAGTTSCTRDRDI